MAGNPDGADGDFTLEEPDAPGDVNAPAPVAPDAEGGVERYAERARLGQGGMGEILLVHDHVIGRDVALKQLKRESPKGRRRFAREARVQGQLEHPQIVPVYDFGLASATGAPYFTMKRVRGVSLRDVIARLASGEAATGRFSRRRLLSAFSQICLAVQYAHERGVVHRDIKPENIMLGDYGEVYLLDWGIAKIGARDSLDDSAPGDSDETRVDTRDGDLLGTIGYMAPEQARGAHAAVDRPADIYALGAILFEILTLKPLHEPATLAFMVDRIVEGVEARPSVRAPHVDVAPELEAVCVAATRVRPSERLGSARALNEAIEAYLDGDRDTELRLESARKHAATATAAARRALDGTPEDESARRAEALREVGRALALDPDHHEALRTLVRLLTTPPRTMPPEVKKAHGASLEQQTKRAALLGSFVYAYIVLNVFLMYRGSVIDWPVFLGGQGLWVCAFFASVVTTFRPSYAGVFAMLLFGTGACVWSTGIISALNGVPSLLAAHAVLYCLVNGWRRRLAVLGIVTLGWTVSVVGDWLGLFPKTMTPMNGGFFIHSPVVDLSRVFTTPTIYTSFLAMIVLPATFVGVMRALYSKAELRMRLQAWQLGQLVPDEASQVTKIA